MKRKILMGSIARFLPKFFFAPDGDGGGGGAATIDPPAGGADDPALKAGNAEVLDFSPPGLESIDLGEPPAKKPEGGAPPAGGDKAKLEADRVAAEKKVEADKAAAALKAKGEAPDGDLPIDKLREAYKTTKAELATLKESAAAGDPRVKELETERDAAKKEWEAARKDLDDRKARDIANDPEVLKPLREMDAKYDADAQRFYDRVDSIDHQKTRSLLPIWGAIKKGTAGWEERRDTFNKALNGALGAEGDDTHKDFDRAREWIADSYEFSAKRNSTVQEIQKTAATRYHDVQSKSYAAKKADLNALIEKAKVIPDGMETTKPNHPKVTIKAVLSALKPEQVTALTAGIPEFIALAQLGVPPRSDADYAGMSPEQITAARSEEAAVVEQARAHLPDVVYNGMIALRILGAYQRDNARLRERLGMKRDADPPDPGGENNGGEGKISDDLKGFVPPALKMNY